MDYKITKQDWQKVLKIMNQYNRDYGFVNIVDGKFTFFDSNAIIDNVGSFYVTKSDVNNFLLNY
tara:strand:- start:295 stop:486 length:192 start_codon:yes stop_codon:yes gene_type:complete